MGTRTTVIAPVGPETWTSDPPKIAATSPAMMAVASPASAPRPLATPNPSARGSATMPTVRPATKSARIQLATRSPLGGEAGQTAVAALAAIDQPLPKPRVLMSPKADEMVTAYVATSPDPGAEQALKMIIERENAVVPELPSKDKLLGAGKNAIRLSPPLVLTREQATSAVKILDEVFESL